MAKSKTKIKRKHIDNSNNRMVVIILGAAVVMFAFACYVLSLQKEILDNQSSMLQDQYSQQSQQLQQLQDKVKKMQSQNITKTP